MRKILLSCFILAVSLLTTNNTTASTPDFSMIGFATLNGGTTGGEGGQTVKVSTFADLKKYAEDPSTPYVIQVEGEINTGIKAYIDNDGKIASSGTETTYGEVIKLGSNKTLIGIGANATLSRIGINVQCKSNIIIRNLKITLQNVPISKSDENKIVGFRNGAEVLLGDPDCIGIQADDDNLPSSSRYCRNIWIDHCEFYNYNPEDDYANKDRYDGLIDIKNDVQYVTISWCYFHDHSKACLFGKGGSDQYNRTTTLHHNFFENIKGSRLPLLRFGQHHYFNNYQYGCEDGLQVRVNSHAYVEACYFENCKKPVFGKSSESGKATLIDNIFNGCKRLPDGYTNIDGSSPELLSSSESFTKTDFVPSNHYNYSSVLDKAEDIPAILKAYAGVGKIKEDSGIDDNELSSINASAYTSNKQIVVSGASGCKVNIYTMNGILMRSKIVDNSLEYFDVTGNGCYIVQITSNDQSKSIKVTL
ncbi:hypothetical protein [Dysgonomonas sp. 520]|uniref:pectate lyase family protein n=1 Tax=Dysgonomonas sp. 520 TaxID=2302931 RepID=UPI0013D821A2|nr:hypothetical protein [Dysgonomonas sp. 520]NDW09289.1 hypothetical protein [Dysgonomonas sp. 520]